MKNQCLVLAGRYAVVGAALALSARCTDIPPDVRSRVVVHASTDLDAEPAAEMLSTTLVFMSSAPESPAPESPPPESTEPEVVTYLPGDPELARRRRPSDSELLAKPVPLCDGVRILEWKASRYLRYTAPSAKGVAFVKSICREATEKYPSFLARKGYTYTKRRLDIRISLLPANVILDGAEPRNLCDSNGRFYAAARTNTPIWGMYTNADRWLYVRNDPFNARRPNVYFHRAFLHELAHAMDDQWTVNLYSTVMQHTVGADDSTRGDDWYDREDANVEEFVTSLGFDPTSESSYADWRNKVNEENEADAGSL